MTRLAVGLFTMRKLDEPMPQILERVADAGYEGVEFVHQKDRSVEVKDVELVAEALRTTGLESLGVHAWLHELEDDLPEIVEKYSALNCDTLIVPYHPGSNFRTEKRVRRLVERLNNVAERVDDYGFDLLYHPNHWDLIPFFDGPVLGRVPSLRPTDRVNSELRRYDGDDRQYTGIKSVDQLRGVENQLNKWRNRVFDHAFIKSGSVSDNSIGTLVRNTPFGYLLTETDPEKLGFEIDVSFFMQQGYDPAEVLDYLNGRVKYVHAKDVNLDEYQPGYWPSFVNAGKGAVDFKGVAEAAQRNGIEWVIFENGHAEDPIESIEGGMEALQSAGLPS